MEHQQEPAAYPSWLKYVGYGLAVGVGAYVLYESVKSRKPKVEEHPNKQPEKRKPLMLRDYQTVRQILQNRDMSPAPQRLTFPGNRPEIKSLYQFVSLMLLYNDQDHTRLRKSYPKLNSKKDVEVQYHQLIQNSIDQLLDKVEGQDVIDVMKDVGVRLPWIVISHIAGVPLEDVPRAAVLIRVMGHFVGTPFNKELMEKAAEALLELREMINKWTNEHWAPQSQSNSEGGAQTQLFPHWLNNEVFESREEFESNVVMLLFAATHNLENVLGNAVRLLLQHEDQLEKIRADNSLLDPAVEEILRFCPAIRTVPRTAREDIEFDSGLMIQKGQTVILSIFDANRDPTIWENPNTFDITRNVDENSKHLTFGFGIHLCVGNAIARLQVRLVIENILLKRYPHARLVDSGHVPDWEHTYSTLESLPLYTNAATDETRE